MTRLGVAPDCHGRPLYRHDRVQLELTPEDAGRIERLERHGQAAWALIRMDDGRELLLETWRLEGPR